MTKVWEMMRSMSTPMRLGGVGVLGDGADALAEPGHRHQPVEEHQHDDGRRWRSRSSVGRDRGPEDGEDGAVWLNGEGMETELRPNSLPARL